jgi:hypothetical protein
MSARKEYHPEKVRSRLSHPVIDGDGHWIEYGPVFAEQVRKAVGDKGADGLLRHMRRIPETLSLSIAERRRRGIAMEGFWGRQTTNTRDRATAMMPRMLYDRLDELGLDFAVIYPTAGLGIARIDDDETRRAVVRGFNIVTADYFREFSDRMAPAAVIPMHTPEEAIEELEFVTRELGAKVGMFASAIRRQLPAAKGLDPEIARFAVHYDQIGLDSDYDYDPVWQNAASSRWPRPSTPVAAALVCATRRAISPSTTSAISPRPVTRSPRRCSWAASRGASPMSISPFSKAASAGPPSSLPI